MNHVDCQKEESPVPANKPIFTWQRWRKVLLTGSAAFVFLVLTVMVLGPWLADSSAIKQKIQAAVIDKTGGRFDFQELNLSLWPRPAIELRRVSLTLPGRADATISALHLSPKIFPLLRGDLHLAEFELKDPQVILNISDNNLKQTAGPPYSFTELQKNLTAAIGAFSQVIGGPKLRIDNGRITVKGGKRYLLEIEGLDLHVGISQTGSTTAQASLQGEIALLKLLRNNRQESAHNLKLACSAGITADRMAVKIGQLSLAEPHLSLSGDVILAQRSPAITLNLSGTDIDAEEVRRTALALAGNITPVKEIFDYLRGGLVSHIAFTSYGENWSEAGDLNNILIKGHLVDGRVSIPEIELDLTEVAGDVTVSRGILQGSGVSVRMNESVGRNGSLQIGLDGGQDLFKLEIVLNADLADTHSILQRVLVDSAFKAELKKIGNVKGTGSGKLILGDSLNDISAKVDIRELDFAADYQRVPLPVAITQGQVVLDSRRLELTQLQGTLGQSILEDLSCQVTWDKDLLLDIGSGRFDLNITELYPWLVTLEGVGNQLQNVREMTGRLQLADFTFKGVVDRPSGWQFSSSGSVEKISAKTSLFSETIDFTGGTFQVKNNQLGFEKLHAASRGTAVTAAGIVRGFRNRIDRVELSLDGRLDSDTVAELSETLKVPKRYALRAPLDLQHARITWQPDSTVSFKGVVVVAEGPMLTADADYLPGQLQIHQLDIKDLHSDARMVVTFDKVSRDFSFNGTLENETFQKVFIEAPFEIGSLKGDFSLTIPQTGKGKVVTAGQLTGENLPVFLLSGNNVHIEKITLNGDGPNVHVDIPKLVWRNLVWDPIKGTVSFSRDRAECRITEGKLCGIHTLGRLSYAGNTVSVDMTLQGKNLDVSTSYTCLTEGRVKATGRLDFSSKIEAHGQMVDLVKGLHGPLEMTLNDGVIEQSKLTARTLEVLNVTEIFKGRLPNFNSTGLAYKTIALQGEFDQGSLMIDKFYMVGETLDLLGIGEIHLEEKMGEGQLLAAPLKTVDTVVKQIPGVNYLLGGTLVSIPVSIKGPLDDPQVAILSVSAVSSKLYNMAERLIKSPIRLFQRIIPQEDAQENERVEP